MQFNCMTISEIKTAVCQSFEIEESDFVIFGRSFPHSHARYAYFVLCRKYTIETQKVIGESVLMCHKSVQTGLHRHGELIESNRDYAFSYREANKMLKQLKDSK